MPRSPRDKLRLLGAALAASALAAQPGRSHVLHAFAGSTPVIDGVIAPGEWVDAFQWVGIADWDNQFAPVIAGAPIDLDVTIFVKRDNQSLYFAFEVIDDTLYRVQTEPFLPGGNPSANNLTQQGWPWFGDEIEILMDATNARLNASVAGVNGSAWQMVLNAAKSRLGGLGVGGLLEGEPRSSDAAWANYGAWIRSGAMRAATRSAPGGAPYGGSAWVAEWAIDFDPCIEIAPKTFYAPDGVTQTVVGLNIALGDVDEPATSDPTYGLRHEMWLSGSTCAWTNCHTLMNEFSQLVLEPGPRR